MEIHSSKTTTIKNMVLNNFDSYPKKTQKQQPKT